MLDRALAALIDEIETAREIAALKENPYDSDPMLNIPLMPFPDDLPYDGEVPPDVIALAEKRRAERTR